MRIRYRAALLIVGLVILLALLSGGEGALKSYLWTHNETAIGKPMANPEYISVSDFPMQHEQYTPIHKFLFQVVGIFYRLSGASVWYFGEKWDSKGIAVAGKYGIGVAAAWSFRGGIIKGWLVNIANRLHYENGMDRFSGSSPGVRICEIVKDYFPIIKMYRSSGRYEPRSLISSHYSDCGLPLEIRDGSVYKKTDQSSELDPELISASLFFDGIPRNEKNTSLSLFELFFCGILMFFFSIVGLALIHSVPHSENPFASGMAGLLLVLFACVCCAYGMYVGLAR